MKTTLIASFTIVTMFSGVAYAADARIPVPLPTPAVQSGFFFNPYVGADYQYSSISYEAIPGTPYSYSDFFADSFNGGDVHVGARIHRYLGFEVGYFDNASSSKSNILGTSVGSSVKFDGWTLDALGYFPLGESDKFELIGLAGVARTTGKSSLTASSAVEGASSTETESRVGGGAEYWITSKINVRGMLVYQSADFEGVDNHIGIARLGVNYQF